MAGEITVSLTGQLTGTALAGEAGEAFPPGQLSYDSSTPLADKGTRLCTTSDVSLTTLFVNTATIEGLLWIKNLDATNYVKLGPTSGGAIVPMIRLRAGKVALIPLEPGLTLRVQANTASCQVAFRLYAGSGSSGA